MGSVLKETLKSLCCSNGWSYGVFWRLDQRNSMLLTMEDAYYEEEIGAAVNNMLLQAHMLGEGLVGRAALSGKCQWIFSDANNGESSSAGSIGGQDMCQDDYEIQHQVSSGLKTIAVIPVESRGVIHFGSTKKILETPEFLDQTKRLFSEMDNINVLASQGSPSSSFNYKNCDLNEWFASFCSANITPMHGGSSSDLMEIAYTSMNLTQSSGFASDFQQEKINPLYLDSSPLTNQLQTAYTEAQVIRSSNPTTQFEKASSQSAFSVEKSAAKTPFNGGSIITSLESQLPSETGVQDSSYVLSTKEDTPVFCVPTKQDYQGDSTVTSLYRTGGLVNVERSSQQNSGRSIGNWHSASSFHANESGFPERETNLQRFPEELKLDEFATDISNCFILDNIFEWFASPPDHGINKMAATIKENFSQSAGVASLSSDLIGDGLLDIPFTQPANSMQSSITDAYVCGGEQKSVIVNDAGNDLFEGLGLEYGKEEAGDIQENMMKPAVSVGHLATGTCASECVSELEDNSAVGPRKGLFSELGIEKLLNGSNNSSYITNPSIDDQFSTAKRRRLDSSLLNQVQLGGFSCSSGSMTIQPAYHKDKASNLLSKKEVFPKSQVGRWIDDGYIIDDGGTALGKSKKPEEPTKATRKRARPGESTRPRPKDRQQIQDRMKELKGIIPDGGKCSIDALLDRTIKYMLFLQSVTKYADKLKQADDPKLISEENKTVPKHNSTSGGGATWALEVGDQSMVCPIIVEDLSPPGLMRIEMLCEDRGFFLEIADVIRGFGLNILKGLMETREDKIWARFIVEANTNITRIDILWSLVQLLQLTSTSGIDSTNQPSNVMNGRVPLLNNYQQPALPCSIGVAEALQ